MDLPTRDEMIAAIRAHGSAADQAALDMVETVLAELDVVSDPLGRVMATMPRWPCGRMKVTRRFQFEVPGVQAGWAAHEPCDCAACQKETDE